MGKKNQMAVPQGRMSKEELKIVKFIVQRLVGAYCDGAGRPMYARSMNRVMKDVFRVKNFTKALGRALRSHGEMIKLMKALDLNTVWAITRSPQHYRMLGTLVAIDDRIVKLTKQLDKIAATEPATRPTKKYRKTHDELKRYEKRYRQCVKLMREIFDIKKIGDSSGLLDFATQWRDSVRPDGSYLDYFDDYSVGGSGVFGIESMEEFVASERGRKSKGAFGIFDELDDDTDYDMDEMDDGTDDLFQGKPDSTERLAKAISTLIDRKLEDIGYTQRAQPIPSYTASSGDTDANFQIAQLTRQNQILTQQLIDAGLLQTSGYIGTNQPLMRGPIGKMGSDLYVDDVGGYESGPSPSLEEMMGEGGAEQERPVPAEDPAEDGEGATASDA